MVTWDVRIKALLQDELVSLSLSLGITANMQMSNTGTEAKLKQIGSVRKDEYPR